MNEITFKGCVLYNELSKPNPHENILKLTIQAFVSNPESVFWKEASEMAKLKTK